MAQGGLLNLLGLDPRFNKDKRERLMLQELQNKGQLDVQRLQNEGMLGNTRAGGEESRKTNTSKAESEKMLEMVKSNNAISEVTKQQILGILAKEGVIGTDENIKVFDKALTDPRIKGALQQQQLMNNVRATPEYGNTMAQGINAQNLAPAFANMKAGTMTANQGDILAAPPSGTMLPPADLNSWNQMQGSGMKETVETPMLMYPGTKEPIPGQPKVTRESTGGRIRANPALLQQAEAMNGGIPGATADPVMQMIRRMQMMQQ